MNDMLTAEFPVGCTLEADLDGDGLPTGLRAVRNRDTIHSFTLADVRENPTDVFAAMVIGMCEYQPPARVGDDLVTELLDWWTMRTVADDPGCHLAFCDGYGTEYVRWTADELAEDPALVLGAILNVARGCRPDYTEPDEVAAPRVRHTNGAPF